MQEELRRCNYLGDTKSLYGFSQISISDTPVSFSSVSSITALNPSLNVKIKPCLAFWQEIGFLTCEEYQFVATELGMEAIGHGYEFFIQALSSQTLTYLIDQKLISPDAILYNHTSCSCQLKRSGVSLSAAVMRNLLIDTGALIENTPGIYDISPAYESLFEDHIRKHRSKMTLEQLMKIHKRQEIQGRQAEEFVLDYEHRRLLWSENSSRVKQISDFDVSAGYDIISFESAESRVYDRFIEVKSFSSSQSFFWSSNEMKTARELKGKYYLYLVDMEQYQTNGYEPIVVQDPANTIFNSDDWAVETDSVKVTRV